MVHISFREATNMDPRQDESQGLEFVFVYEAFCTTTVIFSADLKSASTIELKWKKWTQVKADLSPAGGHVKWIHQ